MKHEIIENFIMLKTMEFLYFMLFFLHFKSFFYECFSKCALDRIPIKSLLQSRIHHRNLINTVYNFEQFIISISSLSRESEEFILSSLR
jgi:hypothetical protein